MPVRRALDMLSQDQLVTVIPHRGAFVRKLDAKAINDIYDVRAQIESMSIILAINNLTESNLQTLRNMLAAQEQYDISDWNSHNQIVVESRRFHRYITSLSKNDYLLHMFDSLWEQSESYRRAYYRNLHSESARASDHEHIVKLMELRASQEAADYIIMHVRKSQAGLLQMMGANISPLYFKPLYIGAGKRSENPAGKHE